MSLFVLQFEWAGPPHPDDQARRPLEADSLDAAKLEAAIAYAMGEFKAGPPTGYCIFDATHQEAYRFPEAWRQRPPQPD